MDSQMKKGLVEVCILTLLSRGDSYGYQLIKDIGSIMDFSESTLYPVLRRLEGAGSLKVYSVEHNGRLRKYYAITEEGKKRIQEFLVEWADVKKVYDFIAGQSAPDAQKQ